MEQVREKFCRMLTTQNNQYFCSLLDPAEVSQVMNKYGYHVILGDQDWFTNVGFEVGKYKPYLNKLYFNVLLSTETFSTIFLVSLIVRSLFSTGGNIKSSH